MTTKMLESYFIRKTFRLVIIGTFWNILPTIEKIQKRNPKTQKSEHET